MFTGGGVMLVTALWCCTWGRGREGAMVPAPLSTRFQSFTPLPTIKLGSSVLIPEWVGLCTPQAPVGLSNDLSCESGSLSCCCPNPHRHFQLEVWGFLSPCWSPGFLVCFAPRSSRFLSVRVWGLGVLPATLPAPFSTTLCPALSVYLCVKVGPQGLLVIKLPAPFVPHSTSLVPPTARRVLSVLVPVSAPPASLDVCFFFIYLVSGFLAIQFSVSSGCARRRSVSTYAAILILPTYHYLKLYVHI